jgi:aspartyl-tRNA(Asn)/glutamyl-tRNA(Gln) amidotransferase subunit C
MDSAEVKKIASLARLKLSDAEIARLATQLSAILGYFDKLREVKTDGVAPASHPPELVGPRREDVAAPWPKPQELVALSRDAEGEFYRVPRVLE